MTTEDGFLAAIAAEPDDDTHRLIFADWLEENDQPDRAELLRIQCELVPIRDDYDSDRAAFLRERETELLRHFRDPWQAEKAAAFGDHGHDIYISTRRGLPASVQIPVQWFIEEGEALKSAYPTVQRLELFRVHGWAESLSQCPHLADIRELEIACWIDADDVIVLLQSTYLHSLRLLRIWVKQHGDNEPIYRALDLCERMPGLERVEVLWGDPARFASRPLFQAFDPFNYLFTMAPDGGGYFNAFFPGKLPDGTQVFGQMPRPNVNTMPLLHFDRDGNQLEERLLSLPTHLVPTHGMYEGGAGGLDRWWAWEKAIAAHLVETLGHRPCLIRVKDVQFSDDWGPHCEYLPSHVADELGLMDDPEVPPEDDGEQGPQGYGGSFIDWIQEKKFVFWTGNDWWVNGITGDVEST